MNRSAAAFLLLLNILLLSNSTSEANFFGGQAKQVGNYQALFLSSPKIPSTGEETFLNFSLLDNNGFNVVNVALYIEIRKDENTIHMFPEKSMNSATLLRAIRSPRMKIIKLFIVLKLLVMIIPLR